MERLTGRYENGIVYVPQGMMPEALERLAAYEDTGLTPEEVADLLAIHRGMEGNEYVILDDELRSILFAKNQGRLVVLPCKVGDTVYVVEHDEAGDFVDDYEVIYFYISSTGVNRIYASSGTAHKNFRQKDIGKTVFLTREEAEAALKGGLRMAEKLCSDCLHYEQCSWGYCDNIKNRYYDIRDGKGDCWTAKEKFDNG